MEGQPARVNSNPIRGGSKWTAQAQIPIGQDNIDATVARKRQSGKPTASTQLNYGANHRMTCVEVNEMVRKSLCRAHGQEAVVLFPP